MGLWINPQVPAAVQARLREAVLKAMAMPGAGARLQEIGFDAADRERSPEELTKGIAADYERMGAVLREIGFKPE
jgi:tripartite-type tricarboxylate transporter receptor subunit TctC